jgi:hypothetical protein
MDKGLFDLLIACEAKSEKGNPIRAFHGTLEC